ncbi:MAG: hypothetical protein ACJ8G1_13505 [Vitreoscilla sp.]
MILAGGVAASYFLKDASQVARAGNFVIGTGVWMTMRYTLREGIKRTKNALDESPMLPGPGPLHAINPAYFNRITFSIGDALLQLHGFALVIAGSLVSSYGDLLIRALLPRWFPTSN